MYHPPASVVVPPQRTFAPLTGAPHRPPPSPPVGPPAPLRSNYQPLPHRQPVVSPTAPPQQRGFVAPPGGQQPGNLPTQHAHRPRRELAPPLKKIHDPDSCEEGGERIDMVSFIDHILYLWEDGDDIVFATEVLGENGCLGEHLGCYFANVSKGGEYYFVDKTRFALPDGFRVYSWGPRPLGGIPTGDKHTFFRWKCPRGAAGYLRDALVRQGSIPFHSVYNNCQHFERDLRAAALGVAPAKVRSRSVWRTYIGDILRGFCCPCCAPITIGCWEGAVSEFMSP
ncbi:unnamed protein product [Vitrella brassicaformis CCMP3155]|uniref:Uncharacterized protein n=1 Tax=Vitrella brassicaformis (strain CCMP3155) TaxID=1169540 RepID=A0A0G4EAA3_VITBC|nr:unnamed protein product [Vitrella brassicaformis CCMP3155]|eukprot:CEL92528.1 unnamed protein product [Vitrella brassicaformis CCMP3155]